MECGSEFAHRLYELPCPSVAVCCGDDVATSRDQGQQHGSGRIHAAGCSQAVLSALQNPDFLFQGAGCGVPIPPVLIRSIATLLICYQLLSVPTID